MVNKSIAVTFFPDRIMTIDTEKEIGKEKERDQIGKGLIGKEQRETEKELIEKDPTEKGKEIERGREKESQDVIQKEKGNEKEREKHPHIEIEKEVKGVLEETKFFSAFFKKNVYSIFLFPPLHTPSPRLSH